MTVNSTDVRVLRVCVWYRKCVQVPLDLAVTGPLVWMRGRPLAVVGHQSLVTRLVRKGISPPRVSRCAGPKTESRLSPLSRNVRAQRSFLIATSCGRKGG